MPTSRNSARAPHAAAATEWTVREREMLAAALALVQEVGYDRMTVDEVAARAHASKMTVYRRWPSKADLVVAAVTDGIRQVAVPPNTGSLRTDLFALAHLITEQLSIHADTLVGVLPEVRRNPELRGVLEREFIEQRRQLIMTVFGEAVERGEIEAGAVVEELWDLLPGYLVFRSVMPTRPVTEREIEALIDKVLMPSLTDRGPDQRRSRTRS